MTDYGHDLLFGTFLTPTAAEPERVVGAGPAHRAGRARPGHRAGPPVPAAVPRHLDAADLDRGLDRARCGWRPTWPTCRCARRPCSRAAPPASTCSPAAGVELGLGAGAFWDAIEANGGPRRTPGEAVDRARGGDRSSIRALWAPRAAASGWTASTTRCAAPSAGPAPAHDDRASGSARTSRGCSASSAALADGWLPSAGYAPPDALPAMNRTIDEAAARRRPRPRAGAPAVQHHRQFPSRFLHADRLGRQLADC